MNNDTIVSAECSNCIKYLDYGVCEYYNVPKDSSDVCDEWEFGSE